MACKGANMHVSQISTTQCVALRIELIGWSNFHSEGSKQNTVQNTYCYTEISHAQTFCLKSSGIDLEGTEWVHLWANSWERGGGRYPTTIMVTLKRRSEAVLIGFSSEEVTDEHSTRFLSIEPERASSLRWPGIRLARKKRRIYSLQKRGHLSHLLQQTSLSEQHKGSAI